MPPAKTNNRTTRVAEALHHELARLLLTEVKDPGLEQVNLTRVRVSRDLSVAHVNYLIIGLQDPDGPEALRLREQIERALHRAHPFLRREAGQRLKLRVTPQLLFHWDSGIEHGRKMDQVLSALTSAPKEEP